MEKAITYEDQEFLFFTSVMVPSGQSFSLPQPWLLLAIHYFLGNLVISITIKYLLFERLWTLVKYNLNFTMISNDFILHLEKLEPQKNNSTVPFGLEMPAYTIHSNREAYVIGCGLNLSSNSSLWILLGCSAHVSLKIRMVRDLLSGKRKGRGHSINCSGYYPVGKCLH